MSARKRRHRAETDHATPRSSSESVIDEQQSTAAPEVEESGVDETIAAETESVPGDDEETTEFGAAEGNAAELVEEDFEALYRETSDKLLRTKAEFDNYRKRMQREFGEIRQQTKSLTVEEFLLVYDHFQMALAHSEKTDDLATLRQGIQMIQNEFERTFSALGVEAIDATGQVFDPELHEAIAQEASEDIPEGHIVRQWKAGFRAAGRLLRPASVIVSSGPAAAAETAEAEAAKSDG